MSKPAAPFKASHEIKPGCGYWDTTHFPLGGCFKRCGAEPLPVEAIGAPVKTRQYGYLMQFRDCEGNTLYACERVFSPID